MMVILIALLGLFVQFLIASPLHSKTFDYIDLGYGYDNKTLVFPGGKKFGYTRQDTQWKNGIFKSSNDFETGEHSGTHLDAPYHFNSKGRKVGEIPIDKLITTAVFVNASLETGGNPKFTLPASKLIQWEKDHGPIPDKSVLLVSFGWGWRYPDVKTYFGGAQIDQLDYPGLSTEAARWIVDNKKIVGVGVDTPSVDAAGCAKVHDILNGHDIYHLENVNMSYPFIPTTFDIIVMPMKLMNGTGAPTRVIAKIPHIH